MFRSLIGLTAATLILTGLIAAPASAATPGCVTRAEFDRVHRGDTFVRVARLFDTRGIFASGGAGGFEQAYIRCGTHGAMASLGFSWHASDRRNHVFAKDWTADAASPGRVSAYEYMMIGERISAATWMMPPYDSGNGHFGISKAFLDRIFDTHGHRNTGATGWIYTATRQAEWNRQYRTTGQYFFVHAWFWPNAALKRIRLQHVSAQDN